MNKQEQLSKLESQLWLTNKEIKRLVQNRSEIEAEIRKLKKELNINAQSDLRL